MHGIDQVAQIAAETVELPHQEPVALPQRLQAGGQAGLRIEASRRQVFLDVLTIDAGGLQRITLQIQNLGAIRLGNAPIADQHIVCHLNERLRDSRQ
jgi:hypothetical protein